MDTIIDIEHFTKAVSRIVIAVDKSPALLKGARYVAHLFPQATYYLINVVNITDRAIVLTRAYEDTLWKIGRESIEHVDGMLREEGVEKVHHIIKKGAPSKVILQHTKKHHANLIVLGSHSKIGSQAIGLGGTSRAIIEKTKTPVLLFTPHCRVDTPRVILNPSSGSKYSFRASMLAIRLAHALGAEVKTLYIGDRDAEALFNSVRDYAKDLKVKYTVMKAKGDPGPCIIENSKNADLMVASRGRPGISYKFRFLNPELALGKLEREVLGMAEIPILLVPD